MKMLMEIGHRHMSDGSETTLVQNPDDGTSYMISHRPLHPGETPEQYVSNLAKENRIVKMVNVGHWND